MIRLHWFMRNYGWRFFPLLNSNKFGRLNTQMFTSLVYVGLSVLAYGSNLHYLQAR